MLEVFASCSGLRLGITTKSDLVPRDTDLLREISRRHYLTIAQTITTLDADLARLLEPLAPRPDLRLGSARKLAAAGIRVIVFCAPVLPAINDSRASLESLASAAAEAGASGFGANILFLKPSAQQVFLPFLEAQFPALVRRYREHYGRSAYLRGAYPDEIRARIREIRKNYWPTSSTTPEPELWPHDAQLELFVDNQ
jgi:DNA repair photolyase